MKILLIKLSALGDVLASTPFFRLLKESHQNVEVHHLVMRHCAEATEANPWVDQQIVIGIVPSDSRWRDIRELIALWRRLVKESYDVALIFHRSWLFQVLCKLSGVRRLVGFESTISWFLECSAPVSTRKNRTLQEHSLLELAGLSVPKPERLEFYVDRQRVNPSVLENLPAAFIACNPGGGNVFAAADNRMWPAASFAEWIQRLPYPVVLLGRGAADTGREREILCRLEGKCSVHSLVNRTNLHETAEVLRRATLYVGNDSAMLYLAAALGKPTLGLFGPTQRIAANPLGTRQYYLVGTAPCSPCYNPYDGTLGQMYTCRNNVCMQNLSVDEVLCQTLKLYEAATTE